MLDAIHGSLDAGTEVPTWPSIIPEAHRDRLRSRSGLRDRLKTYHQVLVNLAPIDRTHIASCLKQQNRISELCRCLEDCEAVEQLPQACQEPIEDLYGFAFSLLTDLGVRDRFYRAIFDTMEYRICPFCGCEYFDAPEGPREDLDHYLPKSRYPFAAANLRNLVPMGMKCNERYKKAQDILHSDDGARRRIFDPYLRQRTRIDLESSLPFCGEGNMIPKWQIEFVPESPECLTWDLVFQFRDRIIRNVLNPSFNQWLNGFKTWFKSAEGLPADEAAVIRSVNRYAAYHEAQGLEDRAFLKAAVFRMLYKRCNDGDSRLIDFMCRLVGIERAA